MTTKHGTVKNIYTEKCARQPWCGQVMRSDETFIGRRVTDLVVDGTRNKEKDSRRDGLVVYVKTRRRNS